MDSSYFIKMTIVGFQYEPSSDVNEACFEEEQYILNSRRSRKIQNVTEWCRCGKWGVMHTNNEYLSCGKVEALEYFQLLHKRWDDSNVVFERVSTTFLQLYLIKTPAQISKHIIEL